MMIKFVAIACTLVLSIAMSDPGNDSGRSIDARQIIGNALRAMGGREKMLKPSVSYVRAKGIAFAESGTELPLRLEVWNDKPDKCKAKTTVDDHGAIHEEIIIRNGDKGWIRRDGVTRPTSVDENQEIRAKVYSKRVHRLFPLLEEPGFALTVLGDKEVEGKKAIGVHVLNRGHYDIDLYFEKGSWLLIKDDEYHTGQDGKILHTENYFSKYKRIDGAAIPTKQKWYVNGKKYLEQEFVEIAFLKSVDAKEFEMP
jgi:hypothetical protein